MDGSNKSRRNLVRGIVVQLSTCFVAPFSYTTHAFDTTDAAKSSVPAIRSRQAGAGNRRARESEFRDNRQTCAQSMYKHVTPRSYSILTVRAGTGY